MSAQGPNEAIGIEPASASIADMAVSQRTDVGGQKPIFQRGCGMELLSLPQEALGAKAVATFRKHALRVLARREAC